MLQRIQNELYQLIAELKHDQPIEPIQTKINEHLQLLKMAQAVQPDLLRLTEKQTIVAPDDSELEKEVTAPTDGIRSLMNPKHTGMLERKLRGGILLTKEHGTIFVPEKEIRQKGFEHGDTLSYIPLANNRFYFECISKRVKPASIDRAEVDYAIVSESDIGLVVKTQLIEGKEQPLLLNGEHQLQFIISEEDRKTYNIAPGDKVIVAYNTKSPNSSRIVWRYLEMEQSPINQAPNI